MNISFCLITLNEEEHLPRCLRSCADLAEEIVVLDSGSEDATGKIAGDFGARWHHQDWLGYVAQKNKVLSLASHEWVFSIDADEEQTQPPAEISGFDLPRCVLYEGRWIRHGDWYPDRLPRLFRKARGHFAGGSVHEALEVSGRVQPLRGELYHHSFRDAADHWARCQRYARLWAEDKFKEGKTAGALSPWFHAELRWLRGYVLRRGFLDGAQGWRIAAFCAREVFLKYQLLRELNRIRKS